MCVHVHAWTAARINACAVFREDVFACEMVRGKVEEPNLQSPLSKLRRVHPLKAGGGKEGGERERKSVNCRKSRRYNDKRQESDKEKRNLFRLRWHRLSRGRTKLTGNGIDDAGRRRLHSHREVNSPGRSRGKDIQRMLCVVYVCDEDRNIHTRATRTHIRTHTER